MVMALETWRVMVGLSLMALWYSVEQSSSVKPRTQIQSKTSVTCSVDRQRVCMVHVTEKFTLYGRVTVTSTDRSTVARMDIADISYGFCTEHRTGYKMVKPRA